MAVTNRLVYDPTDANTVASSSTIGGYVLAGDDGTPIGHVSDALKVDIGSVTDLDIRDLTHVSDSVKIGDGTEFLAVNVDGSINAVVTATDLDIRALTQTDEITAYQGTSPWVIGDGGGSITVDASDLDIRDLTAASDSIAAWLSDGSGNAIGSTAGALDVNIASGDIDDSLANTAIENTTTAVSTSAVAVVSSALASRKWLAVANEGNKVLYIGKSGVTTANGFPLYPGMQQSWRIGATPVVQAIGGAGASSEDLRVMELS